MKMTEDAIYVAIVSRDAQIRSTFKQEADEIYKQCGVVYQIKSLWTLADLERWMTTLSFTVFLLDVDTVEADAFIASLLQDFSVKRYFILAYQQDKKSLAAYRALPARYVRKQFYQAELKSALQSVIEEHRAYLQCNENLVRFETREGRLLAFDPRTILYIENMNKEQHIVTAKQDFWVRKTLASLQQALRPIGFLQPHTSYLVNSRYIRAIDYAVLTLSDQTPIPISKYRRKAFLEDYKRIIDAE